MQQPQNNTGRRVAVIGGGITGLCAAYRLVKSGASVRLFEAGDKLGGSIQSQGHPGGWLVEKGPNTILDGEPEIRELIAELGLESELAQAREGSKKRFILRDGVFHAVPMSPVALLTTRLFSKTLIFRVMRELFLGRRERSGDVSLARFVEDHFGREIVDYALNPVVSGIYAGDPERLSTKHAFPKLWEAEQAKGSIIRGMMAAGKANKARGKRRGKIVSFKNGLGTLVEALAAKLPLGSVQTGARLRRIVAAEGYQLDIELGGVLVREHFDRVVLALPAHALAELEFGEAGEKPLTVMAELEHPSVSSLFLGYRREQVSHALDGFGGLIPAVEKRPLLGVLFSSSLFEGRAPEGHVALTVMIGGVRNSELARRSPDELLDLAKPQLKALLGVSGEPVFMSCSTWPRAIPQYSLGYDKYKSLMETVESAYPGLFLAGNCRDGIAVPSCVAGGLRVAGRVDAMS